MLEPVPELQDVVDDLAAQVGRPISVDDRRFRLLAHSAHEDEGDADLVRRRSILSRHTSEEVVAWLTAQGLLTARAPVDLPENAPLGMAPRTVAPLRHGDVLLGFLWVITGATPLSDDERARFAAAATRVEAVLRARRAADDARAAAASALLGGDAGAAAAALGWPGGGRFVVAVARGGEEDVAARAARRLPDAVATGATLVARGCPPAEAAAALLAAGAARAAAGREVASADDVPTSAREAALALLVADARPVPCADAVLFGALGAWADVADLWDRAGRPPAPPVLDPLDEPLRAALEAVLDAGGDVARAAAAIPVHRATLYRRLERIEELTGHDLTRGDDRLRLHLALRLRRLSRADGQGRDEPV